MKQVHGWWFPDDEIQLPAVMTAQDRIVDGRLTWQYHKYEAALRLLPPERRRTAIDIGAHVGLFSYWMARDFAAVVAYEPVHALDFCWHENLSGKTNVMLVPYALGAAQGTVRLQIDPTRTGGTHVVAEGGADTLDAPMRPLDDYPFERVDFIKIDVEGYEPAVIEGARQTLRRHRPVILVEEFDAALNQQGFRSHATCAALEAVGMVFHTRLGHDYIYGWPAGA